MKGWPATNRYPLPPRFVEGGPLRYGIIRGWTFPHPAKQTSWKAFFKKGALGGAIQRFILLGFVYLWVSCSPLDRFSEYRGVNLLEGKSWADWTPDYNEAPTPAPANPGGEAYMLYASAGATAGYNGTEAYRLRTKNLFPNGDFEASTVGSSPATPWVITGAPPSEVTITTTNAIHGKSLQYNLTSSNYYVSIPLSSLADDFLPDKPYAFRFLVKYYDPQFQYASFDVNTNPSTNATYFIKLQKPIENKPYYEYPTDFKTSVLSQTVFRSSTAENRYLFLNTVLEKEKDPQRAMIDNIRFVRSDLLYRIRLVLNKNEPGRLPLPSGAYRFSFYVKQDPQAGANNVFPASRISFGIGTTGKTLSATAAWSDWTLVSHTFSNLQIDPGSTMELWISATDSSNDFVRDCGSILISAPSLEFLPDGP